MRTSSSLTVCRTSTSSTRSSDSSGRYVPQTGCASGHVSVCVRVYTHHIFIHINVNGVITFSPRLGGAGNTGLMISHTQPSSFSKVTSVLWPGDNKQMNSVLHSVTQAFPCTHVCLFLFSTSSAFLTPKASTCW